MAVTVASPDLPGRTEQRIGSFLGQLREVTFDASYAAGGEPLTPQQFGLGDIALLIAEGASGYVFEYDRTNEKLIAYQGGGLAAGGIKQTIVAGTTAGDVTVTGIAADDVLISVLNVDFTDASETGESLTSEFSVTGANTINNACGTDSSGGFLIVTYEDVSADVGEAAQEVPAGTDLSALVVRCLALGTEG